MAGNPYFIDIDILLEEKWITESELKNIDIKQANIDTKKAEQYKSKLPSAFIDYENIASTRDLIFQIIFNKFYKNVPSSFNKFYQENQQWLDDYSLFMTLLEYHNYKELYDWEDKYKFRDEHALKSFQKKYVKKISYYKMLQYFFFKQWNKLKNYAHKNGIQIIGDIPIYVALTSVDTWRNPENFDLDKNLNASNLSGCPANKKNKKDSVGQVWDSPVYNWDYLEKTNYKWWTNRLKQALELYDVIRIDHFKAFDKYYNIDAETRDTVNGRWKEGPGYKFWKKVAKNLNYKDPIEMPIFAEDLGIITPSLQDLLNKCKFEGMKVIQYAFNDTNVPELYKKENIKKNKNIYLPHNYEKKYVAYLGTHDNTSILGWTQTVRKDVLENAKIYFEENDNLELCKKMIKSIIKSKANLCILTLQDIMLLGHDSMINKPGTVGDNWKWQLTLEQFKQLDYKKLYGITKQNERI